MTEIADQESYDLAREALALARKIGLRARRLQGRPFRREASLARELRRYAHLAMADAVLGPDVLPPGEN